MLKKTILILLIGFTLFMKGSGQENRVIPPWYLNAAYEYDKEHQYGIGISDLNGNATEKEQVCLYRAVLNLALFSQCEISSILKKYDAIDNTSRYEEVLKVMVKNIPGTREGIAIAERWQKQDGHLYVLVKSSPDKAVVTPNTGVVKAYSKECYYQDKFLPGDFELEYYIDTQIGGEYRSEGFLQTGQNIDTDNIYVAKSIAPDIEIDPQFREWFGNDTLPPWFQDQPFTEGELIGHGRAALPNLYLADLIASLRALSDLSQQLESQVESLLSSYTDDEEDDSYSEGDRISKTVARNKLNNISVSKRSVGIDKEGNFCVCIQVTMDM